MSPNIDGLGEKDDVQRASEMIARLEMEKRLLADLVWACPLVELRAFVGFYARIAHGDHGVEAQKILAWANDLELMR